MDSSCFISCSYLCQGAVGAEVGWFDGVGPEVRHPVEAEQRDGRLHAVREHEGDRVGLGRPHLERGDHRACELVECAALHQAQHLDELAGSPVAEVALEATTQHREALRQRPVREGPGHVDRAGLALEQRQVVHGVVGDVLSAPVPRVHRDQFGQTLDADRVDPADDAEIVVGVAGGDRVVVAVEAHQGQGVGLALLDAAGLERRRRQREHRGAVDLEALRLGLGLAAHAAEQVVEAQGGQVLVELGERVERRHRDEEVATTEPDEALDDALLVAPGDPAEPVLEEEVALQAQELARQLALAVTHDLGDRDRGVVVVAQSGDAAEELERCDVALLEGLGALAGVGRDEEGVRVGKRHDRECGLSALARDLDGRLAEVELGAPRRVAEGHEDLGRVASLEGHVAADLGLAAPVVVLVSEALEDPLRGVALLAWRRRVGVLGQDLVDHGEVGPEPGLATNLARAVAGGLRVLEDLLEGPPAHLVVPADLSLGDLLDEHLAPDLCPQFHVCVHPSPVCSPGRSEEASGAAGRPTGMSGAVVFDAR